MTTARRRLVAIAVEQQRAGAAGIDDPVFGVLRGRSDGEGTGGERAHRKVCTPHPDDEHSDPDDEANGYERDSANARTITALGSAGDGAGRRPITVPGGAVMM